MNADFRDASACLNQLVEKYLLNWRWGLTFLIVAFFFPLKFSVDEESIFGNCHWATSRFATSVQKGNSRVQSVDSTTAEVIQILKSV